MKRTTIDYGIDLGTTNSAIAVFDGVDSTIITNEEGSTTTPSAVWIDKRRRVHVGREAKNRFEIDIGNTATEFKGIMGHGEAARKLFEACLRELLPQELSAEVLKSLKQDIHTKFNEELLAAVITVPAAFDRSQCDATREAAKLAGFVQSPLLQEPVAAALAYGFSEETDEVRWLVYDFGGGTFDSAVIQIRDGVIQVVNHQGDNHLGGKLIDWDIVEKLLIPHLKSQFSLTNFERGQDKWVHAIARLKGAAEQGKIKVCRERQATEIWIEDLCEDDDGNLIELVYELTPEDIQDFIRPYVARSLELSKTALAEKGLTCEHILNVLMVGGTTLIPWLREEVERELKIPLLYSIDPMTVVAQGAAIFAGTQRLDLSDHGDIAAGTFKIDLEYDPIGADEDPDVVGRVHHSDGKKLFAGYTIEFTETRSEWRSGRIPLANDGTFEAILQAEKGRRCEFQIDLSDVTGRRQNTSPDRMTYTIGVTAEAAPLSHSLGVALENNQVSVFFKKGVELPARHREIHRTTRSVKKGEQADCLRIPIVEGENVLRADRNLLIGELKLSGVEICRDLPAGSEVEITMHVDESGLVRAEAYIPSLDQPIEEVFINLVKKEADLDQLRRDLDRERERIETIREQARKTGDRMATDTLVGIDLDEKLDRAENAVSAAKTDLESATGADAILREVKENVDKVEDALEWPILVSEAQEKLENTHRILNEYECSADEQRTLRSLESELSDAIDSDSTDILRQKTEEIGALGAEVKFRQPEFWIGYFQYLEASRSSMRDSQTADQLFIQGSRAIRENDFDGVQSAVRQLVLLLPAEQQEAARGYGGTTQKE